MPVAQPYLCRQHGHVLGVDQAAAAAASATGTAAGSVVPAHVTSTSATATVAPPPQPATAAVLVRALPAALAAAAARGVEAALASLGDWRHDPDMVDLADDLEACLSWGPCTTKARGVTALRRLAECIRCLPALLRQAVATPDVCDMTLSAFVAGRLRVNTSGKRIPEEWQDRPIPEPISVRSETMAIVGLMRTARIIPADPRGTLPALRRTMRKTGCLNRNGASPRGYTFLWELVEAWNRGIVPRNDPQAVAALGLYVTGIQFLLRPKYVREVQPHELIHCGDTRYRLVWAWADKARSAAMTAASAAASRRSAPTAAAAATGNTRTNPLDKRLPAKHPRVSASQGDLLHTLHHTWRQVRGSDPGPLFCRTEVAKQTFKLPPGATLVQWRTTSGTAVPTFIWKRSKMSERILKRWLVRFLTPIVGQKRALRRVLSGLRGGGEMELVELCAPVSVRATVGWWVAKRVSAEGALVTYEGSSLESMWSWTVLLGTLRIRVLAPGVFTYVSRPISRSSRVRSIMRRQARDIIDAARAASAASAALAPSHAAPSRAAAAGAGAAP